MITNRQKKRIHHLANRIGLITKDGHGKADDGAYRNLLLKWYAVSSCLALDESTAENCIKRLAYIAHKMGVWETHENNRTKYNDLGRRPGYATPAQLRMIEALWVDVSYQKSLEEKQSALRRFLLSHYRISNLRWLDASDVSRLIATLAAMEKRGKGQQLRYEKKRQPNIGGHRTESGL